MVHGKAFVANLVVFYFSLEVGDRFKYFLQFLALLSHLVLWVVSVVLEGSDIYMYVCKLLEENKYKEGKTRAEVSKILIT